MEFNVFDYALRERGLDGAGYAFYRVDVDTLYPAMIDHAEAVIEANDMSQVPRDQRGYVAKLRQLGDLSAANVHVDEAADVETREQVLETLRLWFTRMLKTAAEGPVGLKITGDAAALAYWRLEPKA